MTGPLVTWPPDASGASAWLSLIAQVDPDRVECVNCGPGLWETLAAVLGGAGGVVGAIVAAAALIQARRSENRAQDSAVAAKRSADAAEESVKLSRELTQHVSQQLEMQREQYQHFVAEQEKRPDLSIAIEEGEPRPAEPGVREFPFVVTVTNKGDRDAMHTTLNIYVPADPIGALWFGNAGGGRAYPASAVSREPLTLNDEKQPVPYDLYADSFDVVAKRKMVKSFVAQIRQPGAYWVAVTTVHDSLPEADTRGFRVAGPAPPEAPAPS